MNYKREAEVKKPPCETIVKELLPLLRACLANILIKEYDYSIYQASKVLGVTPAAISNYLTARRSDERLITTFLQDDKLYPLIKKYAKELVNNELDVGDVLCILCRKITDNKKHPSLNQYLCERH